MNIEVRWAANYPAAAGLRSCDRRCGIGRKTGNGPVESQGGAEVKRGNGEPARLPLFVCSKLRALVLVRPDLAEGPVVAPSDLVPPGDVGRVHQGQRRVVDVVDVDHAADCVLLGDEQLAEVGELSECPDSRVRIE